MFTYTADQITAAAEYYAENEVTPSTNMNTGATTWSFTGTDREFVYIFKSGSYMTVEIDGEALTEGQISDFMEVAE